MRQIATNRKYMIELAQKNAKLFSSFPPRRSEDKVADALFDLCGYLHEHFVANRVPFGGVSLHFGDSRKGQRVSRIYSVICSGCGGKMEKKHVFKVNFCKECVKKHDAARRR